jgi:biotin carboxyl carrier protein
VPEPTLRQPDGGEPRPSKTAATRAVNHAAIERLAEELLPALIARLAATGLGELEVREGAWRVRLRRPADGAERTRRYPERRSRSQPGHAGHGHAPGALEGHRPARSSAASLHSPNGSGNPLTPVGPGHRDQDEPRHLDPHRAVATSPAVGVYRPASDIRAGSRVRAGDRIGVVDMLGIPQEVIAPADGIVGASLVEVGQAVEYGQELIVIELAALPSAAGDLDGLED